ncbi:IQ calmodulin-binding motif protein [Aspergillus stella-maris]|uniref:IQ calmodulin-binding motif protein n=1 Tax=Aspergillus stella-maris TaxID=1810926 RepID=UPI003CCDE439
MSSANAPAGGESPGDVTASALLIQRVYRGHRTRRELQGHHLTATNRWVDVWPHPSDSLLQADPVDRL